MRGAHSRGAEDILTSQHEHEQEGGGSGPLRCRFITQGNDKGDTSTHLKEPLLYR